MQYCTCCRTSERSLVRTATRQTWRQDTHLGLQAATLHLVRRSTEIPSRQPFSHFQNHTAQEQIWQYLTAARQHFSLFNRKKRTARPQLLGGNTVYTFSRAGNRRTRAPTIHDALAQVLQIQRRHSFGVRKLHCNLLRNRNLIYPQVGVRRDNSPSSEVHPFPRQVAAEPSLFPLQPLHESPAYRRTTIGHPLLPKNRRYISSSNL